MKCAIASPTFFLLWLFVGSADSQVVVTGPDGRSGAPPNNPEHCAAGEPLRPNLILTADTNVPGRVTDQKTAPLKKPRVGPPPLITAGKHRAGKTASPDADRKYDLGI